MERIVIEVDEVTARKWKYVQSKNKQKVTRIFEQSVAREFKNQDDYWLFLANLRKQAEQKGFDDNVLNQLLNEE